MVKNPLAVQEIWVSDPWVEKTSWRRAKLPTGEFHRERSLVGYSP